MGTTDSVMVVMVCEGAFEGVEELSNREQALGFCVGFAQAADMYGSGSVCAYIMPEDETALRQGEAADVVEKALREIQERETWRKTRAEVKP